MNGLMDFLEKAGLVKRDFPEIGPENEHFSAAKAITTPVPVNAVVPPASTAQTVVSTNITLNLDSIYSHHGVNPTVYPAERLIRLIDGLSAMDEATRRMAINAMDAADESWTIEDPLNDAAAKMRALATYGSSLAQNLQQLEQQTQAQLDAVNNRQEKVLGEIRKQIAELEGLVEREMSRSSQEIATQEANLRTVREQIAKDLAEVAQVSQQLQSLSSQFGFSKTNSQD
jgi:hypothetical protein